MTPLDLLQNVVWFNRNLLLFFILSLTPFFTFSQTYPYQDLRLESINGQPGINFSNDASPFDARLLLSTDNRLSLIDADLNITKSIEINVANATNAIENRPFGIRMKDNSQTFEFDNARLNTYGLGFYTGVAPWDNNTLRPFLYQSSWYGLDYFTGGDLRMRIDRNGNTGFGTKHPGYRFDLSYIGANLFHIGANNGNDFTIGVADGMGLVNLVAGAKRSGATYRFTGNRGASRILMNDDKLVFYTSHNENRSSGNNPQFKEILYLDKDVTRISRQLRLTRVGSKVFHAGKNNGNDLTIDIANGQGQVNLVSGAHLTPDGYKYLGGRGSSRLQLSDGTFRFFAGDDSNRGINNDTRHASLLTITRDNAIFKGYSNSIDDHRPYTLKVLSSNWIDESDFAAIQLGNDSDPSIISSSPNQPINFKVNRGLIFDMPETSTGQDLVLTEVDGQTRLGLGVEAKDLFQIENEFVFGNRDKKYLGVNAYYDGTNWARLTDGTVAMLNFGMGDGFLFQTAEEGTEGSTLDLVNSLAIWNDGTVKTFNDLRVHGLLRLRDNIHSESNDRSFGIFQNTSLEDGYGGLRFLGNNASGVFEEFNRSGEAILAGKYLRLQVNSTENSEGEDVLFLDPDKNARFYGNLAVDGTFSVGETSFSDVIAASWDRIDNNLSYSIGNVGIGWEALSDYTLAVNGPIYSQQLILENQETVLQSGRIGLLKTDGTNYLDFSTDGSDREVSFTLDPAVENPFEITSLNRNINFKLGTDIVLGLDGSGSNKTIRFGDITSNSRLEFSIGDSWHEMNFSDLRLVDFWGNNYLNLNEGRVGVGKIAEDGYALDVEGTIHANTLETESLSVNGQDFSEIANASWTREGEDLYYSGGNVGIGTNVPNMSGFVSNTSVLSIDAENGSAIEFSASRSVENQAVGWQTYLNNGNRLGDLHMTRTNGGLSGDFVFRTNNGTGGLDHNNLIERLTLKADGKLGLGTTEPGKLSWGIDNTVFTIEGKLNGAAALEFAANRDSDDSSVGWHTYINGANRIAEMAVRRQNGGSSGDFVFRTNNGDGGLAGESMVERFLIKDNGDVVARADLQVDSDLFVGNNLNFNNILGNSRGVFQGNDLDDSYGALVFSGQNQTGDFEGLTREGETFLQGKYLRFAVNASNSMPGEDAMAILPDKSIKGYGDLEVSGNIDATSFSKNGNEIDFDNVGPWKRSDELAIYHVYDFPQEEISLQRGLTPIGEAPENYTASYLNKIELGSLSRSSGSLLSGGLMNDEDLLNWVGFKFTKKINWNLPEHANIGFYHSPERETTGLSLIAKELILGGGEGILLRKNGNVSIGYGFDHEPSNKLEINGDIATESLYTTYIDVYNTDARYINNDRIQSVLTETDNLEAEDASLSYVDSYEVYSEYFNGLETWSDRYEGYEAEVDSVFAQTMRSNLVSSKELEVMEKLAIGTTLETEIDLAEIDPALIVNGPILATRVKVELQENWPDYVFEEDYKLLSLDSTASFIEENKHLPNVPSSKELEKTGLDVEEMMTIQMKKIEELTLHLIEMKKQLDEQKALNEAQGKVIEELQNGGN
jgi:hypothetical protein